ncbi:MAG: hypothetical protein ACREHG_04975 [Candidatus Saccharimonadales bacterium]
MAEDWRVAICDILGAPSSGTNLTALSEWAVSEGMPAQYNNWLATTENGYGGRVVNSVGVKAYPSVEQGAAATVKTLSNGRYNDIISALRDGTSLTRIFAAINQSPWCGGCQSGHYPVALYNYIIDIQHGHVPPPSTKPPTTTSVPKTQAGPSGQHVNDARNGWGTFIRFWNVQMQGHISNAAFYARDIRSV